MKKIRKSLVAVILTFTVVTGTVSGGYQMVMAASIAVPTAASVLESILLSFGIMLLPSALISDASNPSWWEDGSAALDPYYEQLEKEYNLVRYQVINGGGGNPQPSPSPEPGVTPVPGDIPTFSELVAPALAGGAISWASGAWETMGKAISNWWDRVLGRVESNPSDPEQIAPVLTSNYPYFILYSHQSSYDNFEQLYTFRSGSCLCPSKSDSNNTSVLHRSWIMYKREFNNSNSNFTEKDRWGGNSDFVIKTSCKFCGDKFKFYTNLPYFSTYEEGFAWRNSVENSFIKKEEIWVHPDLENTYQNNGKFEYPQQAPTPLQIPSPDQLAETIKKLNPEINPDYTPEMAPSYIQELIQQLQKDPSVDPDPNPDPQPTGSPDPNPDPQPTGSPDPQPTGSPDPSPDEELNPYKTDLTKVFPFCIPFDLIHLLRVFDAEPQAPVFEFPLDLELDNPFTGKKVIDYHHIFKVDMKDYEPVVKILRIFQVIFFVIALMMITRQQMIKG